MAKEQQVATPQAASTPVAAKSDLTDFGSNTARLEAMAAAGAAARLAEETADPFARYTDGKGSAKAPSEYKGSSKGPAADSTPRPRRPGLLDPREATPLHERNADFDDEFARHPHGALLAAPQTGSALIEAGHRVLTSDGDEELARVRTQRLSSTALGERAVQGKGAKGTPSQMLRANGDAHDSTGAEPAVSLSGDDDGKEMWVQTAEGAVRAGDSGTLSSGIKEFHASHAKGHTASGAVAKQNGVQSDIQIAHHSTLGDGKAVKSAGMVRTKEGRVKEINNSSGHYAPSLASLYGAVDDMDRAKMGISHGVGAAGTRVSSHDGKAQADALSVLAAGGNVERAGLMQAQMDAAGDRGPKRPMFDKARHVTPPTPKAGEKPTRPRGENDLLSSDLETEADTARLQTVAKMDEAKRPNLITAAQAGLAMQYEDIIGRRRDVEGLRGQGHVTKGIEARKGAATGWNKDRSPALPTFADLEAPTAAAPAEVTRDVPQRKPTAEPPKVRVAKDPRGQAGKAEEA
jgi:hypothetical protein